MKKLKLPIIRGDIPSSKSLSMDDYLEFVNMHLKYILDRKTAKGWERFSAVKAPFLL